MLSQPAQAQLRDLSATRQHAAPLNRTDSFQALKSMMQNLLVGNTLTHKAIRQLQHRFTANPVNVRPP